jgi:hypothetical protein
MKLFTPRMLRSFAIGFIAGAIAVAAAAGDHHGGGQVVPTAIAAPTQ